MSRDQLLQQVDAEFQHLLSAIEGLSEEAMTRVWYGQWCLRDILAHIAGWHREMAEGLRRLARGERPAPEGVDYSDPHPWNARFAAAQQNTPPKAMVEELKASQREFLEAARQVSEDRFQEGRVGYRIMHASAIDHYREHAPAIRAWREKEGL